MLKKLSEALKMRQKHWDPEGQLGALFYATEHAGEVGELCNDIKKIERERIGINGSHTDMNHLADEAADVLITLLNITNHYGIDLESVVVRKFNETSAKVGIPVYLDEMGPWEAK